MSSPGQIISAAGTQSQKDFVDALIAALPPIYEKDKTDTIIHKLFEALAAELVKADIILESVANNNYVSVPVNEELAIRSSGSRDRLKRENAFELDSIRLTLPGSRVVQNANLLSGENNVQLFFIPENIDFIITDATDVTQASLNFPTLFNASTNILAIIADRQGSFSISYRDTGNVVRMTENITVPRNLFMLGYNEGGYGELGYGQ